MPQETGLCRIPPQAPFPSGIQWKWSHGELISLVPCPVTLYPALPISSFSCCSLPSSLQVHKWLCLPTRFFLALRHCPVSMVFLPLYKDCLILDCPHTTQSERLLFPIETHHQCSEVLGNQIPANKKS